MNFIVHPAMREYLHDLRQYGAAYHSAVDFLEFVDRNNQQARNHHRVSLWSPCGMLQPLRSFDNSALVGVQFECTLAVLSHLELTPFSVENAFDLLALYESQAAAWVKLMFKQKPGEVGERIEQAHNFYATVRSHLAAHPDSAALPPPVRDKWIRAWRAKVSPSGMQ